MSIPSLYTPAEVADYLHVSRGTIYSILSRGEIESLKIGRNRRFTAEQVQDYIKKRGEVIVSSVGQVNR
jgi:putative molybdopterin biosynthesis protein